MSDKDKIEFYLDNRILAVVETSMVPATDSLISIRGKAYRIIGVSFSLDHADDRTCRAMRCNAELEVYGEH